MNSDRIGALGHLTARVRHARQSSSDVSLTTFICDPYHGETGDRKYTTANGHAQHAFHGQHAEHAPDASDAHGVCG